MAALRKQQEEAEAARREAEGWKGAVASAKAAKTRAGQPSAEEWLTGPYAARVAAIKVRRDTLNIPSTPACIWGNTPSTPACICTTPLLLLGRSLRPLTYRARGCSAAAQPLPHTGCGTQRRQQQQQQHHQQRRRLGRR